MAAGKYLRSHDDPSLFLGACSPAGYAGEWAPMALWSVCGRSMLLPANLHARREVENLWPKRGSSCMYIGSHVVY